MTWCSEDGRAGVFYRLLAVSKRGHNSTDRPAIAGLVLAVAVGLAAWMLDGIFIGATRTADMRNMMIISSVSYFITVWPLMAAFGNHGLWLALLLNFVMRGVTLGLRYPALEAVADAPSDPVRTA